MFPTAPIAKTINQKKIAQESACGLLDDFFLTVPANRSTTAQTSPTKKRTTMALALLPTIETSHRPSIGTSVLEIRWDKFILVGAFVKFCVLLTSPVWIL